jgi:hypothetical protein
VTETTGWRPLQNPSRSPAPRATVASSPFNRLATVHLISTAGDTLVTLALAGSLFFNISPNAARGRVALSLVLTMAPFAIVAPFLGPAIDHIKGGRRYMVAASLLARACAAGAMAATLHSLLLFPAAFLMLVFSKAYAVSKSALVPAVVESDSELVHANSRLTVGAAVIGIVASLPGVLVLKVLGAGAVMRLALVVYVCGTMFALRIRTVRDDDAQADVVAAGDEAAAAVRTRGIALAACVIGVIRAVVGFLTFLLAFDLRRSHAPAWWFGVVLLASLGGGLVGAAVAPRLRGIVREETIVIGSLLAIVVAACGAAYLGSRGSAAALAGVVGLANGAGKLAFDSLVQRDAPAAVRGRTFARFEAIFQLVWVIGALIPVAITMSDQVGAWVIAAVTMTTAAFYTAVRLRPDLAGPRRKPAPAAPDPAAPDPAPTLAP